MALCKLLSGPYRCKSRLPIRVMTKGYFGHCTWGKGDVKPPFQPPQGGVTKIKVSLHWRRKPREKQNWGSWRKKLNQASGLAHKVVKVKFATLSSSRCGFTISLMRFLRSLPLVPKILLKHPQIYVYIDAWDPLVLLEKILLYPYLIILEEIWVVSTHRFSSQFKRFSM
jgi:hypothetical protein